MAKSHVTDSLLNSGNQRVNLSLSVLEADYLRVTKATTN